MIIGRITDRFRERASEWFCAANMAVWGAILLHPSNTFASPALEAFRRFGEDQTGWVVGSIGMIWLIGLIINGARQRATSTIRMICATVGSIVYGLLAVGLAWSYGMNGILSPDMGIYALTSLLALYSLFWITVDKRANG